jgi:hypothetical protein
LLPLAQARQALDHDQPIAGKAEIGLPQMAGLCNQHQRAGDERRGQRELEHDQHFAQPGAGAAASGRACRCQHGSSGKARQQHGRIEARGNPDDHGEHQQRGHDRGIRDGQRQPRRRIHQRQAQFGQRQRHQRGKGRGQDRLSGKLAHQHAAAGAEHLAHRHFAGAQTGAGRGQVHVIDDRDQQGEHADNAERQDRLARAGHLAAGGREVKIGERQQRELHRLVRIGAQVGGAVADDEGRHPGGKGLGRSRAGKPQIGVHRSTPQ